MANKKSFKASVINRETPPYVEAIQSIKRENKEHDIEPTIHEKVRLDHLKNSNAFASPEELIARSTHFIRYHRDERMKEYFSKKTNTRFRQNLYTFDKYFEFAYVEVNGRRERKPLYIDFAENEYAVKDCVEKTKACKELGIRYAYIIAGDKIDVILDRLGEI